MTQQRRVEFLACDGSRLSYLDLISFTHVYARHENFEGPAGLLGEGSTPVLTQSETTSEEVAIDAKVGLVAMPAPSDINKHC